MKITIYNKSKTDHITCVLKDAASGSELMRCLAKNDISFVVHGNTEGEINGNQDNNR